jgi:hypothetical protein
MYRLRHQSLFMFVNESNRTSEQVRTFFEPMMLLKSKLCLT